MIRLITPGDRVMADYPDGVWRAAAISKQTTGNETLFVAMSGAPAGAVPTPPHHHGDCETALFVIRGRMRFRFGVELAEYVDAGPGDFLYLEPNTVHSEESLSVDEPVEVLIIRTMPPEIVFMT